jgi:hypothetical protein
MKNLRKFCATTILALALAFSASAGDMSTPGISEPPPPPPTQQSPVIGDPGVIMLDPVTSLTLSLLESVFYLF